MSEWRREQLENKASQTRAPALSNVDEGEAPRQSGPEDAALSGPGPSTEGSAPAVADAALPPANRQTDRQADRQKNADPG